MKEKILGGLIVVVATMTFIAGCTAGSLLAKCVEIGIERHQIKKAVKEHEKGTN